MEVHEALRALRNHNWGCTSGCYGCMYIPAVRLLYKDGQRSTKIIREEVMLLQGKTSTPTYDPDGLNVATFSDLVRYLEFNVTFPVDNDADFMNSLKDLVTVELETPKIWSRSSRSLNA